MVKRVVDTKFWTSMDVIDHYSVEDKFFALYLMTNARCSQIGIYSLPKKVMSFETGFTIEAIQVLLDRFSNDYQQIVYSEATQEVTLLESLEFSVLKGGKPVSDLMKRELREVKDGKLLLATYQTMKKFWEESIRKFDQTIQSIFKEELVKRKLFPVSNQNDYHNQNESHRQIHIHNNNENHNHSHNQESLGTNRKTVENLLINTDKLLPEEQVYLTKYIEFIKYKNPSFDGPLTTQELIPVFYEEVIGQVSSSVKEKIEAWEEEFAKSLILEALVRSMDKNNPLAYANSIINDWRQKEVKNLSDVSRVDRAFNRQDD